MKDCCFGGHLLRRYPSEARFRVSSGIIIRCSYTDLTDLQRVPLPVRPWGLSSKFSWRFEDFGDVPGFCQYTRIATAGDSKLYT